MKRIDVLPDDILLEIFDFYLETMETGSGEHLKEETLNWQLLVHVCRRWRIVVFQSPLRLNLRLYCTPETPVKDTLDVWPALPLIVEGDLDLSLSGTDNVIAAIGESNRVCQVSFRFSAGSVLEKILAAMQVPFPELTHLFLSSHDKTPCIPVLDSLLSGSAPSLQTIELFGIPFPGLPNLLMSATHLVTLKLTNIPHSGYISPEAMAALISVLSSLETLSLQFESPQSCPDWQSRRLPPPKRSILPALNRFLFKGVAEYLEELVTRIDTPRLNKMLITFFNQIDFVCPRLAQFINCTPALVLKALNAVHVEFDNGAARVTFQYRTSSTSSSWFGGDHLKITILCRESDWQLSSMEQVCNSCLHPLSRVEAVEDLYIERSYLDLVWKNDGIENTLWLQLLLPFTNVKNLYLSQEFVPGIAAVLEELVRGRITEVLPSLQNIFVEGLKPSGPVQENIGRFIAARQLSDHPIAIFDWRVGMRTVLVPHGPVSGGYPRRSPISL